MNQETLLSAIEAELHRVVEAPRTRGAEAMYHMMAYHLGWEGEGAGHEASGKRIRPLLVLLTTASAGGDWQAALPAAAAVELVHNFSLIHDDIEDNSPLRRGRPTVWKLWGIPQAINTGDAMLSLAYLSLQGLAQTISVEIALQAGHLLQRTCLWLTEGQHLDISYETRLDLSLEDYWPMVYGKTAALLSACTELGALVAGVDAKRQEAFRQYGWLLSLAFQVKDDLLGIWGDVRLTGKSVASDLLTGKKTLPILYGLSQNGQFANRWKQGGITPSEVPGLAHELEVEGGRTFAQNIADQLTQDALDTLEKASPTGEAGLALIDLSHRLLNRQA